MVILEAGNIDDAVIPDFQQIASVNQSQSSTMSDPHSPCTPQRSTRRSRRDATVYADMLIEQLMAQASSASDSSTDSSLQEDVDVVSFNIGSFNSDILEHSSAFFNPDVSQAVVPTPSGAINTTDSSTPELPTSGSAHSLDIPFASMYDINCSQLFEDEDSTPRSGLTTLRSPEVSDDNESPVVSTSTFANFPTQFSHSIDRELKNIEHSEKPFSSPEASFSFHENLRFPSNTEPRPSKPSVQDFNINDNYKPHLGNKKATQFDSDSDSCPPIPPRRPLTDSKLGQFVAASSNSRTPSTLKSTPLKRQSPMNTSWSFYDLGSCQPRVEPTPSSHFITVRDRLPLSPLETNTISTSNSKRMKPSLSVDTPSFAQRSARQRLSFTPTRSSPLRCQSPATPKALSTKSPLNRLSSRPRRVKRQSPAMRRLAQQKENATPIRDTFPCKPMNNLNNINANDSFQLTSSSNSLNTRSSNTSPDLPLISRAEELVSRDACYGDFTVDRQQKIDSPRNVFASKPAQPKLSNTPSVSPPLVRMVEGAESSPRSFVFQAPASTMRPPKALQRQRPSSSFRPASAFYPKPTYDQAEPSSRSSSSERDSRKSISSRNPSIRRKQKPSSHPLASSTMITEKLSPETDTGSVYCWSINDDSSQCDLEKSYIRSTKKVQKPKNSFLSTPRQSTDVGLDNTEIEFTPRASSTQQFEISAMVNTLHMADSVLNHTVKPIAAAPSFAVGPNNTQISTSTSHLTSQPTGSSGFFKTSNALASSKECSVPKKPVQTRLMSLSEPALPNHYYDDSEPTVDNSYVDMENSYIDVTSYIDASSLRLDIPGQSQSSSGSSPIQSARCRPYIGRKVYSNVASSPIINVTATQELIDSILTNSPKSDDSDGINAPFNSCNSPVESVGSHNGYSSFVSSSSVASSSDNIVRRPGQQAPPPTPPFSRLLAPAATACNEEATLFKRPFHPMPHVSLTSLTKNQGCSASSLDVNPSSSTGASAEVPSVFANPSGAAGPTKIKDKSSIVRKLKKFSTHFYKKTEKIQTLANL